MKFVHISDLHIGKIIDRMRMLEDQQYILDRILEIIIEEQPDAVLICGDVYDRGVPPAEAVTMLDRFIVSLSGITLKDGRRMQTFIISGNHDSPERLAFGSLLMRDHGVHISPVYDGCVKPFTMRDEFGEVDIYMLPFIRPAHVRDMLAQLTGSNEEGDKIETYTDAIRKAIEMMNADHTRRTVLLSHQFVCGAVTCDSEMRSVGGLDAVDASVYSSFNYVALGHLHTAQRIHSDSDKNTVYYCGTPLKYSFSERESKSLAVAELDGEGRTALSFRPLTPIRDMRTIRGSFSEIMSRGESSDYIRAELTDEHLPSHAYYELRSLYENLMVCVTAASRSARDSGLVGADIDAAQSELDIFRQFFELMHGRSLTGDEEKQTAELIERARRIVYGTETEVNEDAAD